MKTLPRLLIIASSICAATLLSAPGVSAEAIHKPGRRAATDASEAARRLDQAQLERQKGLQPKPGELTPGPGARIENYNYWRRQERMRLVVERALRRSNETRLLLLARS